MVRVLPLGAAAGLRVSLSTGQSTCVTTKVPAAQKATCRGQLDQMRKAWADAARNATAKDSLESSCRQMSDQMKAALSSFGCSF